MSDSWRLLLAVVVIVGGGLTGYLIAEYKGVSPAKPSIITPDYIWVDAETGCEYLKRNDFSPRYGRDGKQICLEVK